MTVGPPDAAPLYGGSLPGPAASCRILVRPATPADADVLSTLLLGLAPAFMVDPDGAGAAPFLQSIQPAAIRALIEAPNFDYAVGHLDGLLAGVVAVRDRQHLFHLFVAPSFQHQGVARRLWEHARQRALAAGSTGRFTVNAALAAVPVYERFGFVACGAIVEKHGIRFLPMRIDPAT